MVRTSCTFARIGETLAAIGDGDKKPMGMVRNE